MFNESETQQLQSLFDAFTHTVEFTLYPKEKDQLSRRMEKLISELGDLSNGKCVLVAGSPDARPPTAPSFTIGAAGHTNIIYAALPTGHQFPPFYKILERIGCGEYAIPDSGSSPTPSPAELTILISDSCPRCPLVVEAAGLLSCENPTLISSFVDVMQFQEFVMKYKILSVPATILDGEVVSTGTVSAEKLQELVQSRGSVEFEMDAMRSLIETQQIQEAAERLGSEAGRKVVLDLLRDNEFSKRLSALVVAEQALEDNPEAVRAMVPELLPMLKHSDSRIRGDVADLLGKTGDPQPIPHLEALLSDPDPDVVEAAEDALEELKKKE
jgi:hypothetical protein